MPHDIPQEVEWTDLKDKNGRRLTKRQKEFCEYFIQSDTLNVAEAMKKAGYSAITIDKKSYDMLRNPLVAQYIERLQNARRTRMRIDSDEVIRRLIRIATKAEDESEYHAALRALELLGKHLQLFTDKQILEIKNPFSSGVDKGDIERDVGRLMKIGGPKLAAVGGARVEDIDGEETE